MSTFTFGSFLTFVLFSLLFLGFLYVATRVVKKAWNKD